MAAPTLTARVESSGIKLEDGFATQIALAADSNVAFWEKTVTPPGLEGGDPIDTTTMFNLTYRTKAARQLIEATNASANVAYDPLLYDEILSLINVETSITIHFPDGSTFTFYGFLKTFTPQEMSEGAMPMANIEIVETDWDYANNLEVAPVLVEVAGT